MTPAEVVLVDPGYWFPPIERIAELCAVLRSRPPATITEPSPPDTIPDPETSLTIVDPEYWGSHLELLADGLVRSTVQLSDPDATWSELPAGMTILSTDLADGPWTMTVEEAAKCLGISRAFAYESVRKGDIPSLRIGRRILVPIQKLRQLVDSAGAIEPEESEDDP
jgi:excisionase family DNA binding protein